MHSNGSTVVNPTWMRPRLVNSSWDENLANSLVAGMRISSPSIDAADVRTDFGLFTDFDSNLLANASFEMGTEGWQLSPGSEVDDHDESFHGRRRLRTGDVAFGEASQIVDLVSAGYSIAELDAGDLIVVFGGRVRSGFDPTVDVGAITLELLDASGNVSSIITSEPVAVDDRWQLAGDHFPLPAGIRSLRWVFEATRRSGDSNDAWLDNAFLRLQTESFLPDIGAEGNAATEGQQADGITVPHIALRYPDLYTDWERDTPHEIRWDTVGNSANSTVRIDLYQDGPQGPALLQTITPSTADDGRFIWIPANSNIPLGTHGLRIQISLIDELIALDRSIETFTVPEGGQSFFVNDDLTAGDEYSTAAGNHRHTGRTPAEPKPDAQSLLRTYRLGPTDTLFVDTGAYAAHHPLVLSGTGTRGDDESFTLTGPMEDGHEARLGYIDPAQSAPGIELDDADQMTITHVTLDGVEVVFTRTTKAKI